MPVRTPDAQDFTNLTEQLQMLGLALDSFARPARWETSVTSACDPASDTPAPAGFTAVGPWEPIGVGMENGRVNGGIEDMTTVVVWRRPLKAARDVTEK